jgi:hypothetical protein
MPLFYGKCNGCGAEKKFLTSDGDWDSISSMRKLCINCGGEMSRDARGLTASMKELLDNGVMPRAVERFEDIEEMKKERLKNADENAGRSNRS